MENSPSPDNSPPSPSSSSPPHSSPPPDSSPPPSSSSPPPSNSSPSPSKSSPSPSSDSPPPKSDSSPPPQSPQSPPPKSPPEKSPPKASPPPPSPNNSSPPSPNNSNNSSPTSDKPSQSPLPSSPSSSPAPPTTNPITPPPQNVVPNQPNSPTSPIFSPPPPIPDPQSSQSPNGKALPPAAPSHDAPSNKSPGSSGSNHSAPRHDNSSSSNVVIVAAIAVTGLLIFAIVVVCLLFNKKKKKQPYYGDPAHMQPKGGDPYYNTAAYSSSPQTNTDHIVTLAPPPGVMGTPQDGQRGWAPPPPPPAANTSSEFSSGYSSHAAIGGTAPPISPNYGGLSKIQFSYADLAAATGGFSQANLLGQGGFGFVHKGVLTDGSIVAVKSLKSGSGQGEREFQAEVEIISRVHHRHLVSLVGFCIADGQRMLVYEFVPNGTLEYHLHGKGRPVMDWELRLKIALGSAKGLAYLHEDCHPRIIHRDIKGANILIDNNYEAMVADFGLAKLTEDNNTHVSTRVMGTFGYLAPEYASSGKLTEKSDVFSFGVMLLELITGRRPLDTTNKLMEDSLVDWARPFLTKALEENNYDELVDPRLEGKYDPDELHRMVACAAASVRHSARRRPKMSQIVRALDGDASLEDLNDKKNNTANFGGPGGGAGAGAASDLYDTRAYNADMVKFRQMVMTSKEFNSSEYGGTSDYGLHPSDTSSEFSSDYNHNSGGHYKQAK